MRYAQLNVSWISDVSIYLPMTFYPNVCFNLMSMNWTGRLTIPACPGLVCSFNSSTEETDSWEVCV